MAKKTKVKAESGTQFLTAEELRTFRENNLWNQIHKRDKALAEAAVNMRQVELISAKANLRSVTQKQDEFIKEHTQFIDSLKEKYGLSQDGFQVEPDTGELSGLIPID